MHRLGISVYPEHSTQERDFAYMELAAKYGFSRIFTCLLSASSDPMVIKREFGAFLKKAHELGFEVAADTNPQVFKNLGASPENLEVFHELGLDIIRLDGHFDERQDVLITRNPYGIKIEFNGSLDTDVERLIRHGADRRNMTICHNFYPERYTGLSQKTFDRANEKWASLGMTTAAFVSSQEEHTFGPWEVYQGLPTLEADRTLPMDAQVRHMVACEGIDDILIGNAYAAEAELAAMAGVKLTNTTVKMDPAEGLGEAERDAVFRFTHTGREDASEYLLRSSFPRLQFKNREIPFRPCDKRTFTRGDVLVVNDNLAHYRGEVEIVLTEVENDGQRNLAGRIADTDVRILDEMEKRPGHAFEII